MKEEVCEGDERWIVKDACFVEFKTLFRYLSWFCQGDEHVRVSAVGSTTSVGEEACRENEGIGVFRKLENQR